ncbi:MAG: hypothetical protein QOE98_1779 [Gaiellaceae bacterium]|nr:hypothetical protein [Gaiellaceae bacterium]
MSIKRQGAGRKTPWEPRKGRTAGSGADTGPAAIVRRHQGITALLGSPGLRGAVLAGTLASAIAAMPASAATGPQGIRPGHNITVFHDIDMVGVFGHPIGAQTLVQVFRGGHLIATAHGPAVNTPDGGALEVNHGPVGAPEQGDCWDGATPNIQPGDRIVVSNPGGPAGVDEAIVDHITIATRGKVLRDAATGGPPVVHPAILDDPLTLDVDEAQSERTDPTRDEVWVEGSAFYSNPDGTPGLPIPPAALDSNGFIDLPADNKLRLGSNLVEENDGGPGTFRTRHWAPFAVERNDSGRGPGSIFSALENGEAHSAGYGHVAPLPPVSMLVDGMGEQAGPAPGCEIAPKEASSAGTTSADALNAAAMAAAAPDPALTVGGFAASTVTAADVVVSRGTASVEAPVTLSTGPGQKGWSVSFTKAQIASLGQGSLTARLRVGGTLVGASKTVVHDVTAPSITVNLAEGTYTGTQQLTVTAGGDPVTYQLDGAAARAVTGQIQLLPGSHTVVLRSTDSAGNTTTRTLPYTILAPPATPPTQQASQPQAQQPAPAAPAARTTPAALIPAASAPAPQLGIVGSNTGKLPVATLLTTSRTIAGASARRNGIVARFSAPQNAKTAVIRVLRRGAGGRLSLVGSKTAAVRRGANSVALNSKALRRKLRSGTYVVQVALRGADGKAGAATSSVIRVIR